MQKIIVKYAILFLGAFNSALAYSHETPLTFGVISQSTPTITAQYWNPILKYVSQRTGVELELKLAKTGLEHAAAINRGEYHFIYSNHNFTPESRKAGYKVIARPADYAIYGEIIVLSTSDIKNVKGLVGKDVVFPSPIAFVGYTVPMDMLVKAGIKVNPLFAGNQEGAIGQLVSGRALAAGVNSNVAKEYALRHNISYKVLWKSEEYLPIPISAHPSVTKENVKLVRDALINMTSDAEGQKILAASADAIKKNPPYGFFPAKDSEYNNVRKVYKNSLIGRGPQ